MNEGRKECTFLWSVENYSYCWHKTGEPLNSPEFTFEGEDWFLTLCPRGYRTEDRDNISLLLYRKDKDASQEVLAIKLVFSLLAPDGSVLCSKLFKGSFPRNRGSGFYHLVQRNEIHLLRKADYLPNDILTVQCKMWKGEGDVQKTDQISARTRIMTEHISFFHIVESFSILPPNVKNTIKIQSHLIKGSAVSSSLYYTDPIGGEGKIIIEIIPSDVKKILQKCKISLFYGGKNIIECGGIDNAYDAESISLYKLTLSLSREVVLNRSEYLPNDKLALLLECTFTNGFKLDTIEDARHELPLTVIKQNSNHTDNKDVDEATEKISEYTSALEDMKALYIRQRLTDVELKTNTKSFPAHKFVLCARSPIFEAMLTSDMKEKITGCIHVDDLENETIQQLLLFLYSDNLETLQWKSATRLFYAADKYQIGKLKAICSSFLKENLSTFNAIELLVLADIHNDSSLMKVVEDFILKHEDQVYSSKDWEKLKETNPQLVIKTMCLKYQRKNEVN